MMYYPRQKMLVKNRSITDLETGQVLEFCIVRKRFSKELIITDRSIIDLKTGQIFEYRIRQKHFLKEMYCVPSSITQQERKILEEYKHFKLPDFYAFSYEELFQRRNEIRSVIKSLKKASRVSFALV